MKTTTVHSQRTVLNLLVCLALVSGWGEALAMDKWQQRLLHNPPESQLQAEERGRVMIYDGLKDTEVGAVLDSQFDRIESMMFVRTVITGEQGQARKDASTGEVMVEDDGC